ncbi:MAG: hypothetical protein JW704_11765 [Anaerolineaceae bacterium]|nr:hypothetical protein [Anaerolineaceae bacterium]
MPGYIDAEFMHVDDLPGIWSPIQWDLTDAEKVDEVEEQARASLMAAIDVPEAILRALLGETGIKRANGAPDGYDPEQQGEWDDSILTFKFKRPITLLHHERGRGSLMVQYDFHELGIWQMDISEDSFHLTRI